MNKSLVLGIEQELKDNGFKQESLEEIMQISSLIPGLTNQRLDSWNGFQLANRLLVGRDLAAECCSIAIRVKGKLYAERKKQSALAYLEKSIDYSTEKGIKLTDSTRANYADMDVTSVEARNKEAAAEALVTYLYNKIDTFEKSHQLCKQAHSADNAGRSQPQ